MSTAVPLISVVEVTEYVPTPIVFSTMNGNEMAFDVFGGIVKGGVVNISVFVLQVANAAALGRGGLAINAGTRISIRFRSASIARWDRGCNQRPFQRHGNNDALREPVGQFHLRRHDSDGPQKLLALNKSGTGRLTLSGSNTYSSPTTISQGKLVVDGWLTNSAVSVNSGGTGRHGQPDERHGQCRRKSRSGRFAGHVERQRQLDLVRGSGDGL